MCTWKGLSGGRKKITYQSPSQLPPLPLPTLGPLSFPQTLTLGEAQPVTLQLPEADLICDGRGQHRDLQGQLDGESLLSTCQPLPHPPYTGSLCTPIMAYTLGN